MEGPCAPNPFHWIVLYILIAVAIFIAIVTKLQHMIWMAERKITGLQWRIPESDIDYINTSNKQRGSTVSFVFIVHLLIANAEM